MHRNKGGLPAKTMNCIGNAIIGIGIYKRFSKDIG